MIFWTEATATPVFLLLVIATAQALHDHNEMTCRTKKSHALGNKNNKLHASQEIDIDVCDRSVGKYH